MLARVRELVAPIAADLGLDLYDIEQRGGTLRVTLDTPAGSPDGVTLDDLALASRLVSSELDHHDPIPSRYTLEVTSPGVERPLRDPGHFQREVGKVVADPPADVDHDERRVHGTLVAADDDTVTVAVDGAEGTAASSPTTRSTGPRPCSSGAGQPKPGRPSAKRKTGAVVVSNLDMTEAIRLLAQEKGLSEDSLLHVLVDALASAYKRRPGAADEVVVEVDPQTMEFTFTAYDLDEDGNWVNERDDTPRRDELGRIAAQTFRQVMSQRIREVERDRKFEEYANREGDIVTGIIQQTDTRYTLLDLGRVEALLPQAEQVPFERPQPGDRCKAYIVEVRKTAKGPQIVVSRTHPGLIKRLFELEVPEIADGIVEIKACAREPGHRTKIAVWSNDHNVDPVGACVGARGGRVRMVVNELRGEKIDIVPFSEDFPDFVAKALSPAKVSQVIDQRRRHAGRRHRARPPAQPGDRPGGPERPPRRPPHRRAHRHPLRDPARRGRAGRASELDEGVEYAEGQWVQNAEHRRDGVARRRRHRDQRGRVERRRRRRPAADATAAGEERQRRAGRREPERAASRPTHARRRRRGEAPATSADAARARAQRTASRRRWRASDRSRADGVSDLR